MSRAALLTAIAIVGTVAACDPVHTRAVDALGGEAPGVRPGPLHRPGQPCLRCHDGALGDPGEFSVAGTVFQRADGTTPLSGVVVTLTDAAGATFRATTNAAGNFYVTPKTFTPQYPMHVTITSGGVTVPMASRIGRDGACAGCHVDPSGPDSPGHVYFDVGDGGVP